MNFRTEERIAGGILVIVGALWFGYCAIQLAKLEGGSNWVLLAGLGLVAYFLGCKLRQ